MLCRRGYWVLILGCMLAVLCGARCELEPLFNGAGGSNTQQAVLFLTDGGRLEIKERSQEPLSETTRRTLSQFDANATNMPFLNTDGSSFDVPTNLYMCLSNIHQRARIVLQKNSPDTTYPCLIGALTIDAKGEVSLKLDPSFQKKSEGHRLDDLL